MIIDSGVLTDCVILGIMIQIRDRKAREFADAVERGQRLLESDR